MEYGEQGIMTYAETVNDTLGEYREEFIAWRDGLSDDEVCLVLRGVEGSTHDWFCSYWLKHVKSN